MKLEELINEAVQRFLRNQRDLPIEFMDIEAAVNSTPADPKYYVYFTDLRLKDYFQQNSLSTLPVFRAVINKEILELGTINIDLIAMIPSNLETDQKIILRVAWKILNAYQVNIFQSYQKVEKDGKKLTWANAAKWYKEIK